MPPIVIDASVALAWALPDESSPYAEAALIVAEQEGMRVPELWAREIANGLAIAYNRKRINLDDSDIFLAALSGLNIEVEQMPPVELIRDGLKSAIGFGLTAYDAAYVELALRDRLALATLDGAMRKAAEQHGISLFR